MELCVRFIETKGTALQPLCKIQQDSSLHFRLLLSILLEEKRSYFLKESNDCRNQIYIKKLKLCIG